MVTLSIESKEMSCADLSWLLLLWQWLTPTAHRRMRQWGTGDFWQILGATVAWFALTSTVHKKLTSSADLQCSLELFASSLVWHSAHWNLYSAEEDRISICTKTSQLNIYFGGKHWKFSIARYICDPWSKIQNCLIFKIRLGVSWPSSKLF